MGIAAEAFVSFAAFVLLMSHMSPRMMRRIVGYKGVADCILHGSVLWLFLGTSTEGLMQAEAAAIMFSVFLRLYKYGWGWERFDTKRACWRRFAGKFS